MKEFEGKKLLILGGIKLICDIVKHAQDMGAYVIVADYLEDSPAKKIANKAVLIDALDVDAIVEFCKEEGVDGVTTGFVDILLEPCYEVCKKLGLPCYITPKMLSMSTNKIEFKKTCAQYGVPVPKTYLVGNCIDEKTYKDICFPVFVKPLDASGSRGAGVCNDVAELNEKFVEAVRWSSSGQAIIEDYISGREFLLDYIAVNGEYRLLEIFDRFLASDRGSAINYSTIGMAPSKAVDYYLSAVNRKVIDMFNDLGFKDGLLFMQGYYDGKNITFFEMGCRLGGTYYNHEQAILGYNSIDMTIRYALNGKMVENISNISEDVAKFNKYALECNFLLKGTDETVAEMVGVNEVRHMPTCIGTQKFYSIGYRYTKDRFVDIPIFVASLVAENKNQVMESVRYLNNIFNVYNEQGKSLLMDKLDPQKLFL